MSSAFVKPRRFLLYARLSLTTEESVSIARQLEAERRYVEARGGVVVGVEWDDGVSATKRAPEDREGWRRILAAAPEADAVVVWKVDRLARRVIDFLHADAALQAHGAGLVAVEDPVDMTTPQGRAFATLLAVFGEMEAAAISARSTGARAFMVAQGRTVGGRRPWAYEAVPAAAGVGVEYHPIPERADAIRWAAEGVVEGRLSLRAVGDEWAARGLTSEGGSGLWTRTSVRRILSSPVLAGATVHRGEVVRNPDGTMRISPERVILDLSLWRRLQAAIEARRWTRGVDETKVASWLTGLLVCAGCGKPLSQRDRRGYRSFLCERDLCPARSSVAMRLAEEVVEAAFLETFGDQDVVEGEAPAAPKVDPEELAAVEEALEDVELLLTQDVDDDEALRLMRQRRELRARLAALRDAADSSTPGGLVVLRSSGETYGTRWERSTLLERAALLRSVWVAVEVSRGRPGPRRADPDRFRYVDEIVPERRR